MIGGLILPLIRSLIVTAVLGFWRILIWTVMLTRWLLCWLNWSRIRRVIASRVSRGVRPRRLTRLGVIGRRMSRLWNIIS